MVKHLSLKHYTEQLKKYFSKVCFIFKFILKEKLKEANSKIQRLELFGGLFQDSGSHHKGKKSKLVLYKFEVFLINYN